MNEGIHPAASYLPPFITAPGETDILLVVMGVFLIVIILLVGVLYFRLHAVPEHIAHKSHKLQIEIVAVLGLLALFTQEHLFWIAGLLLALIDFPDFGGLLGRMAKALEKMAGIKSREGQSHAPDDSLEPAPQRAQTEPRLELGEAESADAVVEAPHVAELRTRNPRG